MATWQTVTSSATTTRPRSNGRHDSVLDPARLAQRLGEYVLLVALVGLVAGALLLEASGALGTLIHDITLTAR